MLADHRLSIPAACLVWSAAALAASPATRIQSTSSTAYTSADVSYFNEALEAPDGTLVVTGHSTTTGAFVARLTAEGQFLWCQSLNDSTFFRDHTLAANGDILACGSHEGGGLVMRLNAAGDVIWQTLLPFLYSGGEDFLSRMFLSVTELSTGEVVLGGYAADNDYQFPLYAAFDAQGGPLWRVYQGEGWITDVAELPNGEVAFAGKSGDYTLLSRFAIDGGLVGMRVFLGLEGARPQIAPSSDGHVLLVPGTAPCYWPFHGEPRCFGMVDSKVEPPEVLKVDYLGTVLWHKTYGTDAGSAVDLVPTPDGGAVVLGEQRRGPANGDVVLLRIDGQGEPLWQVAYGTSNQEQAAAISLAADSGFVCTGRSSIAPVMDFSPVILRTDSEGSIAGCPPEVLVQGATDAPTQSLFGSPSHFIGSPDPVPPTTVLTARRLTVETACFAPDSVGSAYCAPASPNSSGKPAKIHVQGSAVVADREVTLMLMDGPAGALGYFLAGMGTGLSTPPGSQGTICLGGSTVYRFSQLAQTTDGRGAFAIEVQGPSIPNHGAVVAGETWNFQAWFRDANPGVTSNLSHATSVLFL